MKSATPKRGVQAEPDGKNEDTRTRLLLTAIDVFGRHGFEAATTRMLAEAAGVNLQSIPYYFESKEGLYLAVAKHIVERVGDRVRPLMGAAQARLQTLGTKKLPREEARELLQMVLTNMAHLFLHEESAPWARFMIREQMDPTAAYDHVYETLLSPMLATLRTLLGHALGKDPNSEQIRLRALSTIGQVLIWRAGRATLMRQLAWKAVGPDELAAADAVVAQLVLAIVPEAAPVAARGRGRA